MFEKHALLPFFSLCLSFIFVFSQTSSKQSPKVLKKFRNQFFKKNWFPFVFFPTISLNVGLYIYTIRYWADIKNICFSPKHRKKIKNSKKLPCSRIKKSIFLCAYDQILKVFYAYFTKIIIIHLYHILKRIQK